MAMADDTLGDCPRCGHREATYEDWIFEGYREGAERELPMRLFRCRSCGGFVTPDHPAFGLLMVDGDWRVIWPKER
jgi:uncharacterized Zn finger protein